MPDAESFVVQARSTVPARPSVSVAVAAYNVAPYLGQCLDSLLRQTLADFEILVVDDASTDASWEIALHYGRRFQRIRTLRHDRNRGLSAVRNTGIEAARGKYVAFLDGDDWADPDMLTALVERAENLQAEVVKADLRTFDDRTACFGASLDRLLGGSPREAFHPLRTPSRFVVHGPAWSRIYLREFLERRQLRFTEGHIYEDLYFHFAVLLSACRVGLLDRPVVYYRIARPGQITAMRDERVLALFTAFADVEALLTRHGASPAVRRSALISQSNIVESIMRRASPAVKERLLAAASGHFRALTPEVRDAFVRGANRRQVDRFLCLLDGDSDAARRGGLRNRGARAKYGLGPLSVPLAATCRLWERAVDAWRGFSERRRAADEFRRTAARVLSRLPSEFAAGPERAEVHDLLDRPVVLFDRPGSARGRKDVARVREDEYLTRFVPLGTGDVVVDLGAHVGAFALAVAVRFPGTTVLAVEPDPQAFRLLQRNLGANRVNNVVPLCGEPGGVRELFAAHRIERCRLMKVSVAGATRAVLQSLPDERIDFVVGHSAADECHRDELERALRRAAFGWCWRVTGSAETALLFHGGHPTHRFLQPAGASAG